MAEAAESGARWRRWARWGVPLLVAALLRLAFIHWFWLVSFDGLVYGGLAKNLLLHGVYAIPDNAGGVTPTLIRLPGYPLFVAACFKLFGMEHYTAVMLAQGALDLGALALLGAAAGRLWGRRAGTWALWLAALCPFTANYVATPLSETLSVDCILLGVYALVRWRLCGRRSLWLVVMGLAAAAASLLRPDGVLVTAAMVVGVAIPTFGPAGGFCWRRVAWRPALAAGLLAVMPLVPWTVRNWRVFEVFQPLAPKYATDPDELAGYGFNHWYKSWAWEFKSTQDIYWGINSNTITVDDLPARAFDSEQQRSETAAVIYDYNQNTLLTAEQDARFEQIARERARAHPLMYHVGLPTARVADMWLRPRTEMILEQSDWWNVAEHPGESAFAMGWGLLNLLYIGLGVAGWVRARRVSNEAAAAVAGVLVLYVVLRSLLLMDMEFSEPRYTLECYPALFLLGACLLGARKKDSEDSSLPFSSNTEMIRVSMLADELFKNVLYDEEPLFISDEATLWGVAMSDTGEVLERCRNYYGVPVSMEETQQLPLWKLLRLLDDRRKTQPK